MPDKPGGRRDKQRFTSVVCRIASVHLSARERVGVQCRFARAQRALWSVARDGPGLTSLNLRHCFPFCPL